VGSIEPFFLNNGDKAFLFAVRETDGQVGFRVAVYIPSTGKYTVFPGDDPGYGFTMDQGANVVSFSSSTSYVKYVQIDNKIFALSDSDEEMRVFWVGDDKRARQLTSITEPGYNNGDRLTLRQPPEPWVSGSQSTHPTAVASTTSTLVSSTASDNDYNFAFFYTFVNEIGESAASQIRVIKTQRRWSAWNTNAADDSLSSDQLVASMPEGVWDMALAQGALSWNLYMLTWSDQDSVPVEGIQIKNKTMLGGVGWESHGWASMTPLVEGQAATMALPNADNRYNSTNPSHASQGLVAGDRLILVNDKSAPAVIRWSSNQQGNYTNFSPAVGGGYKTLTSGNLYVPAAVQLWQNPQSTDTIAILCMGVDGYSTSYYMQPASVSGASTNITLMGFEETTATAGTVSTYGCEVLNNALYHPLDMQLMKSTASNYNINHKTMTALIQNKWVEIDKKNKIISSQMDNKLFYIVNNPEGAALPEGCNGNEIWVCDTEFDGTWSRWLIPAISLHKIEIKGKLFMGVVLQDTIAVLDDMEIFDTVNDGNGTTMERAIPWKMETNTQGANRAHDAWANLQQITATFGNFHGSLRYGIRGYDENGKVVVKSKIFRKLDNWEPTGGFLPSDQDDHLLVMRNLKEWFFFAESVVKDEELLHSYGQVNAIQYRYTPVTVNIGYAFGEVETFEYTRSLENWGSRTTDNGIPQPFMDTRRT